MMLVWLLIFGYADPYVDYAERYVDWRTGASFGAVAVVILIILSVAAIAGRTDRSSE